ncbi:MAG: N-(5'-phosphoribosyl)anthranilate isomerase [Candidatus Tokpelaia hoelldobleri]|uniref:N-(5'-phosphoribosyl)anthranilate isomerase n=1 Tax=Candidatus Tokpelaia hoelldobleri TaxID=1902579 RepID=A0A1U9JWZ6_9HYPH|nr:MAG: N-(5'-phosphoribosyl)anthranilate isomerase [Candidatus Tokpelaia hoelldoblerii]
MDLDIKICGLKTEEALEAALAGSASHVGFVFFEKSPRHAPIPLISTLSRRIAGRARTVIVTVDADNATLDELVHLAKPDLLQLHGGETPRRVAEIKNRYHLPVMKAISIHNASDLHNITPYTGIADRLLFDAKAPKGSVLPGGNGASFDWSILNALDTATDYMLSGGLRANNIAMALKTTGTRGIDISSGVESAPGIKDTALIETFFAALAQAREGGNKHNDN